jgi:hypothetical protein
MFLLFHASLLHCLLSCFCVCFLRVFSMRASAFGSYFLSFARFQCFCISCFWAKFLRKHLSYPCALGCCLPWVGIYAWFFLLLWVGIDAMASRLCSYIYGVYMFVLCSMLCFLSVPCMSVLHSILGLGGMTFCCFRTHTCSTSRSPTASKWKALGKYNIWCRYSTVCATFLLFCYPIRVHLLDVPLRCAGLPCWPAAQPSLAL